MGRHGDKVRSDRVIFFCGVRARDFDILGVFGLKTGVGFWCLAELVHGESPVSPLLGPLYLTKSELQEGGVKILPARRACFAYHAGWSRNIG